MDKTDIGLIGLSVIGQSLALNIENKGFSVSGYNRTAEVTKTFIAGKNKLKIYPFYTLKSFANSIKRPRKIILLIKAGQPVDGVIEKILPFLQKGDIIIDGGNSFFKDTQRRQAFLASKEIYFLGMGVSGGEEGALKGPSLMIGGPRPAFEKFGVVLEKIAARFKNEPCYAFLGSRGAGHFVKMVHNGVEYGIMQLLGETHDFLKNGLQLPHKTIIAEFKKRQNGLLASYLMEITLEVLSRLDQETQKPLVEVILDQSGQKGTGKWTSQTALDLGVPVPGISSAVEARLISSWRQERKTFFKIYNSPPKKVGVSIQALFDALLASILVVYHQGFFLLKRGSEEYGYELNLSEIAKVWRAGCIIRGKLTEKTAKILKDNPEKLLLETAFFKAKLKKTETNWRQAVKAFVCSGIPCPAVAANLAYFDSFSQSRLISSSLIQGLRDRFGSHGFKRIDKKGDFHVDWSQKQKRK